MLKKVISILFITFLVIAPRIVTAENTYQDALSAWSRTLEKFVDTQGRIDFKALAKQSKELNTFVAFIAATSPSSHPEQFTTKAAVIAYHINAYNALAMHGVIEREIPGNFNSFFKRLSFFNLRKVIIGGRKTSLYDYENKVIRPLGEPRVHFALNCMVRDCPRLPMQPFFTETLEQQLETLTREFFTKEKHFHLDKNKGVVYLSSILDFYTEDFVPSGKTSDLSIYINNYIQQPIPTDYKIRFIGYDWTINQQP